MISEDHVTLKTEDYYAENTGFAHRNGNYISNVFK